MFLVIGVDDTVVVVVVLVVVCDGGSCGLGEGGCLT